MNLSEIIIVLCHPDSSQNVGSVCRAMLTMGISQLRLVGNRENYNEEDIQKLSIHAYQIWLDAKFYTSLDTATKDCVLTAGTTRRKGKKRKAWFCYPEEFAEKVATFVSGPIAVVFGNERTGLTDTELNLCTLGVTIPTSMEFSSLNLSHAVQIITYALFTKATRISAGYQPINLERTDSAVDCIINSLEDSGFFKLSAHDEMRQYWRGIISRAALSESETAYMEKTFKKLAGINKKLLKENNIF
jgi:tRNA/rRNA methyltransferase